VVTINIGELHAYISRGRTFDPSLDALVAEVGRLAGPAGRTEPPVEPARDRLEARLSELLGPPAQIQSPLLYLAATPTEPVSVPTLTRREGVRTRLENPVLTRYDGWNLLTLDQARRIEGERLTLASGTRKHIDLYNDATFFAFGAFESLFAWHGNVPFAKQPKINPLAVIEFTHDFVLVRVAARVF
jgi:hypothetical protein